MNENQVRCLLIETKDGRMFFTEECHYPLLIEFAQTFGASISVVMAEAPKLLDLAALASAVSDNKFTNNTPYKVVEVKIAKRPVASTDRKVARYVKDRIKNKFLQGEDVKLDDLSDEFKDYGLDRKQLSNHIHFVRRALQKQGRKIEKLAAGEYRLNL